MPTATGPELEALLELGRAWLGGGQLTWNAPKTTGSA
jgi:hypothetical protein